MWLHTGVLGIYECDYTPITWGYPNIPSIGDMLLNAFMWHFRSHAGNAQMGTSPVGSVSTFPLAESDVCPRFTRFTNAHTHTHTHTKKLSFFTFRSVGIGNADSYLLVWLTLEETWIVSSIFYFSKSTSINTQHSSLWDTMQMMLFTKDLIKWKHISRISRKLKYWFIL